jgi:hypothetical protein
MNFVVALLLAVALALSAESRALAEEYLFDPAEFEKKSYQAGGYAELRPVLSGLDRGASLYRLRYLGRDEGGTTIEYNGRLQIEASLERGMGLLFVRASSEYRDSYLDDSSRTTLYDGYLALRPSSTLTMEAGKKSLRWGTGYAWNPVAFLDRPKDPDDPELNREGFLLASAAYIKSLEGPWRTVAFSPVLLPVKSGVNEEFGEPDHLNLGGKIYFLFFDTDIDLLFLTGGSRPNRYGIDFSRNISPNFEVHGELAHLAGVRRLAIDAGGSIAVREADAQNFLFGLRYLTRSETTWIIEYYRNGAGISRKELRDFYSAINLALDSFALTGDPRLLQQAENLARTGPARINPLQDYFYLRASRKEPFNLLYFTPAVTTIVNLNDGSFTISPELAYTGITNLELRLKGTWLQGDRLSEYGEKQNDWRLELRVRYFL